MLSPFVQYLLDEILNGKDVYTLQDQLKNNKEQINESVRYLLYSQKPNEHILKYIYELMNLTDGVEIALSDDEIINSNISTQVKFKYLYFKVMQNDGSVDMKYIRDLMIPYLKKESSDQEIYDKLYHLYLLLYSKTDEYVDETLYYFGKLKSVDKINQNRLITTLKLYKYKVKNQKKHIDELIELQYQPGGPGYLKAKQHFEQLMIDSSVHL